MTEMSSHRLPPLHPDAKALTVFRALPDGTGRAYTISEAPSGAHAIELSLRRARAVGYINPTSGIRGDCYAVLDVLNKDDEPIQEFCIPTAEAFRWWYRTLHLRVADGGDQ